jgi:Na+-transporting NADH:ubiquinone oxidoreductase subunit B
LISIRIEPAFTVVEKLFKVIGAPFQKGGLLENYYPAYQAIETIALTPGLVTKSGPHIRDAVDLKRFMIMVVFCITPCALFGIFNAGYQSLTYAGVESPGLLACVAQGLYRFLPLYIITLVAGGSVEAIFSVVRKHEINEGFLVSSLLFPLILPPTCPLWMAAIGIIFGVVIGKEVFGGTGMNIFNPAMTARCFLFFAYPAQMSGGLEVWVAPAIDFSSFSPLPYIDAISGATPLMSAYNSELAGNYEFWHMLIGLIPGCIGETSALLALVGGIALVTMIGCVIGALATATLFTVLSPETARELHTMSPFNHLVMGGFAFGAVFMATDPVSGPATGVGRWIYGILIGTLAVLIRNINPAYPEGMMLAILFMNLFAPLIDHYVMEARIKRRLSRG